VWDPAHRSAAEAEALGRARRAKLRVVPEAAPALAAVTPAEVLGLPVGDWDVDAPDLARYGCGCDGAGA